MWNNKSNVTSKTSYTSKNGNHHSNKSCKTLQKKVIPSKVISSNGNETKSCSTSVVSTKKCTARARRTTTSDTLVTERSQITTMMDYCKKCGDAVEKTPSEADIKKIVHTMNLKSVRNDNKVIMNKKSSAPIQQYYKNKNFVEFTESVQSNGRENNHKTSLDTINEVSEQHAISEDSLFFVYSEPEDDVANLDADDEDNIEKLKQFRKHNYFECHSAKSRIRSKGGVTSLNEHQCVYRFYLNDRLFPVPLNTDYSNKIRCIECQLPMDIKNNSENAKINGTIQAKVKVGKETQDMILLLPMKESLIIKERRKEERKVVDEYVYFGVVKLGTDGNSLVNSTLPQDSLALKYQKGFKQYQLDERYIYKDTCENEVIVV